MTGRDKFSKVSRYRSQVENANQPVSIGGQPIPFTHQDDRLRIRSLGDVHIEAEEGRRYDEVDWTQPSAVIIGGEAEGPSDDARALKQGSVYIPMPGEAESLNAAVAGSVILFEAVRQLLSS